MNGSAWTVNCPKKLSMYTEFVKQMYEKHKYVTFDYLAEQYGLYVSFPTKDFKNGNKT